MSRFMLITMGVVLVVPGAALGQVCDYNRISGMTPAGGNALQCWVEESSFTASQLTAIYDTVEAWNSVPSGKHRGYSFQVVVNPQPSGLPAKPYNSRCEIYARDEAWHNSEGYQYLSGVAITTPESANRDIVFPSTLLGDFCNLAPSQCPRNEEEVLTHTIVHELGHVILGIEDNPGKLSVMDYGTYFSDLGSQVEIQEWDYGRMECMYPASTQGTNVAVSKFHPDSKNSYGELWTQNQNRNITRYSLSAKDWVTDPPLPPVLVVHGTNSVTPYILWRLSADADCSSNDPVVGWRQPTMGVNLPYVVGPYSWEMSDSSFVSGEDFYLCVDVDPNDAITEYNEADNKVLSRNVHVRFVP